MAELDKLGLVNEWFTYSMWISDWTPVSRLVGCSLKVETSGYLAILKGISAEGPMVAFVGEKSLVKLFEKLRSAKVRENLVWRPDIYAFDKK